MSRTSLKNKVLRGEAAEVLQLRKAALKEMNPALRTQFEALETEISSTRDSNLNFYHRIGRICLTVQEHPETYGEDGLRTLEQALSTQTRTLRRSAQFARAYNEQQLEWLIGLKNPQTEFQLHWGHVAYLLSLSTEVQRTRYAEEAVEKMLDPLALHKLIKKRIGRRQDHGRTHDVPGNIPAMVAQMLKFTKQWCAKHQQVWRAKPHDVFPKLLKLTDDELSNALIEDLRELGEELEMMAELSRKGSDMLQRCTEHVDTRLTERSAALAVQAHAVAKGRPTRRVQAAHA